MSQESSQSSSGFNPASQGPHRTTQDRLPLTRVFSEDEMHVFIECQKESFWRRSLPLSAIAFALTHVLVTRGVLAPSPRFGSIPKAFVAAMLGYIGGKVSYIETCKERFKNLENSSIGEALRQQHARRMTPELNNSEFVDPDQSVSQQSGFASKLQPTVEYSSPPNPYSSYTSDDPYISPSQSYDPNPVGSGISQTDDYSGRDDGPPPVPPYQEEDPPKKKSVLYKDLRSKNRENYEVLLTQKAGTIRKPQAEDPQAPRNEAVKKNKYGDAWEE